MSYARTTFAIVALAALVGCTVKSPASTPTTTQSILQLQTTEATYELMHDLAQRFTADYSQSLIKVQRRSFDTLIAQLEAGNIDYLVSSHVPVRDDIWAAPLAVDGLAIVVNQANSVSALTINDLRNIFGGRQRDWSAFGGEPTEITPLSYHSGSDIYLEFQRNVMGMTGMTGNAVLMPGIEAVLQQIAEEAGAIGYLPLSRLDRRVNVLAIDGVSPDASSMNERRYPLRSTIYVIGRESPPPASFNFFGWVQSDAGQAIVAESFTTLP